jgi:serine/threonine-protein kinase
MSGVLERLRGALADRYDVQTSIGQGGMATVYFATEGASGRDVAIKVLDQRVAHRILRERFLREIAVSAGLEHNHIVPIFDSGEADGLLYYVMPYLGAETLQDRMEQERRLPIEDAIDIACQVAGALAYAHARDVVHRDIKPGNILFLDGRAVVADFGVAAIRVSMDERLTQPGEVLGTPLYMSPEQAMGNWNLDARSDIYSLGCVLYESLAGTPPFTGSRPDAAVVRRLDQPPPSIRQVREEVPEQLELALVRALSWNPAKRFETAAEFADALAGPARRS